MLNRLNLVPWCAALGFLAAVVNARADQAARDDLKPLEGVLIAAIAPADCQHPPNNCSYWCTRSCTQGGKSYSGYDACMACMNGSDPHSVCACTN